MSEYYVYAYIDPRNFEPFYYGKGKGSRKDVHESARSKSRLAKRIKEIEATGERPMVRVIARDLTEQEAFLVEATLIWQAEGKTANEVSGHFDKQFRPQLTLHRELPSFDSSRQVYFFNVGDGPCRRWEDNMKYNYVGAGHGRTFRKAIEGLREGDIIAAYLSRKGRGFVGVGKVRSRAKPARKFQVNGNLLVDYRHMPERIADNLRNDDKCEWMAAVQWINAVPRSRAHFKKNAGLFVPRSVRASLAKHARTIDFINSRFGVDLFKLANE